MDQDDRRPAAMIFLVEVIESLFSFPTLIYPIFFISLFDVQFAPGY
jgi:hypothetical protein